MWRPRARFVRLPYSKAESGMTDLGSVRELSRLPAAIHAGTHRSEMPVSILCSWVHRTTVILDFLGTSAPKLPQTRPTNAPQATAAPALIPNYLPFRIPQTSANTIYIYALSADQNISSTSFQHLLASISACPTASRADPQTASKHAAKAR